MSVMGHSNKICPLVSRHGQACCREHLQPLPRHSLGLQTGGRLMLKCYPELCFGEKRNEKHGLELSHILKVREWASAYLFSRYRNSHHFFTHQLLTCKRGIWVFFCPCSPVSKKVTSSNLLACEHPACCTPPNFSYSWWTFLQFYQQYIQFHVAQFSQMWLAWLWFILCTKALAKLLVVFFHILFIIFFPFFFWVEEFLSTPHTPINIVVICY